MPVSGLFYTRSINFMGPLPVTFTGNKCFTVAVEHMVRWWVARASSFADSRVAETFVKQEILYMFGLQVLILWDSGTHFYISYKAEFLKKARFQ